jgi:5-methyltetrahydrofolate--homocysteine methyltransferase
MGTRSFAELQTAFEEQIEALVRGGTDIIIIETMADPEEAAAAIAAAKQVDPTLPLIATMTFEKTSAGIRTMMGTDVKSMVDRLTAAGADIIGANCGMGMDGMIEVIEEIRSFSNAPVLSQANAGAPVWKDGKNVYSESPEERAESVKKLLQFKPQIIGGCCGTTPDHIRAVREVVDEYNSAN